MVVDRSLLSQSSETTPLSPASSCGGIARECRTDAPRISVVISTYNRAAVLEDAVRSILTQDETTFELIIVDNNSTDGTRQVVERFADVDGRVRYVFEPEQGSSHGRNAGIRAARAPVIAFTDDDVRAEPDWLAVIVRVFREQPDVDVIGGRVMPVWPATPPAWLTRDHWTPLALIDYGEQPFEVDATQPVCLVSANLAVRRTVLDVVGGFAPAFQLVKGSVGSVEDHELLLRILRTGRKAVYEPRMVVHAAIQSNRLERSYHRRWHRGHGYYHALLRSERMEHTGVGTLFGVPAHLYRQALEDVVGWVRATATRQTLRAFDHEVRLWFFLGFFQTRRRQFLERPRDQRRAEWRQLFRGVRRRMRPAAPGSVVAPGKP
jgi:glycosyltransferase involved in cell wall biosynthesis